jgi:hypothetical protein
MGSPVIALLLQILASAAAAQSVWQISAPEASASVLKG